MDSAQLAPTPLSSFRLLTFVRLSIFDRKGKISKGEEKKKILLDPAVFKDGSFLSRAALSKDQGLKSKLIWEGLPWWSNG